MKKQLNTLCILALMLCGCTQQNDQTISPTKLEEYEIYYTSIMEHTDFKSESIYFDVSYEMSQVEDGTYRYYVFIDEPKVAMYRCIAMVVENNVAYDLTTKMMPTEGILDSGIHLIPNQYNLEQGYAKGIMLSGESINEKIDIKLMVQWYNVTYTKSEREYLSFQIVYEGNEDEES